MDSSPKRKCDAQNFTSPRKVFKMNFANEVGSFDRGSHDPPSAPRKIPDLTRMRPRGNALRPCQLDFDPFEGPGWSSMPLDLIEKVMRSAKMAEEDVLNMALCCKHWMPSHVSLARILCEKRIARATVDSRGYTHVIDDMFFGEFFDHDQIMEIFKSAVRNGSMEMIKKMLVGGFVNVNSTDSSGQSILCTAITTDQVDIVKSLIEDFGACVNLSDHFGETPIMRAVSDGTEEMVQILIEHGAHVNAQAYDLVSPLYLAVDGDKKSVAELLLRNGALVNLSNSDGETPLFIASRRAYVDIIELLIDFHADLDLPTSFSYENPLHIAVNYGHLDVARLLIDAGASTTLRTIDGKTLLHLAVTGSKPEAVTEYVLQLRNIDINAIDDFDKSALSYAVNLVDHSSITLLLDHGADPFIDDSWMKIGLHIGWRNVRTRNENIFSHDNAFLRMLFCGCEEEKVDDDDKENDEGGGNVVGVSHEIAK